MFNRHTKALLLTALIWTVVATAQPMAAADSIPGIFEATIALDPGATANVCGGAILGNILLDLRNPATLQQAKDRMPCGFSRKHFEACLHDCTLGDCALGLGSCLTSGWILVEWSAKDDHGAPPLPSECQALMQSAEPCNCQLPIVDVPPVDCPDPVTSDEPEDPIFNQGGAQPRLAQRIKQVDSPDYLEEAMSDEEAAALGWKEACRSYALMPRDWDEWTPAAGFFAVGRAMPFESLSGWRGIDDMGRYGILSALAEPTHLGPTLLGIVSNSPLWGGDEGEISTDVEWMYEQGVCVWPEGANLGSPYWLATLAVGVRNFPVLVRCDAPITQGLSLFLGQDPGGNRLTEETWEESGTNADQVLPRLRDTKDYELLCITQEVADLRRELRSLGRQKTPPVSPEMGDARQGDPHGAQRR